jgi:hypothetical protein
MRTVSIELPDAAFAALRKAPQQFVQEMRIAAAVKWYELGQLSQDKAAEVAGISRKAAAIPATSFFLSPARIRFQ